MAQQFVVLDTTTGLFEKETAPDSPLNPPVWGLNAEAREFPTLVDAQSRASDIGGGTVGTVRPR